MRTKGSNGLSASGRRVRAIFSESCRHSVASLPSKSSEWGNSRPTTSDNFLIESPLPVALPLLHTRSKSVRRNSMINYGAESDMTPPHPFLDATKRIRVVCDPEFEARVERQWEVIGVWLLVIAAVFLMVGILLLVLAIR